MGASALLDGSSAPCSGSITAPRQLQGERGRQPCRGRDAGARGGPPAGLGPGPPRGRSEGGQTAASEGRWAQPGAGSLGLSEKRRPARQRPRLLALRPRPRPQVPDDRPRRALLLVRLVRRLLPPPGAVLPPALRVFTGGSDLQVGGAPPDVPPGLLHQEDSLRKSDQLPPGGCPVPPGTLPTRCLRPVRPAPGAVRGRFAFVPTVTADLGEPLPCSLLGLTDRGGDSVPGPGTSAGCHSPGGSAKG